MFETVNRRIHVLIEDEPGDYRKRLKVSTNKRLAGRPSSTTMTT